MKYMATWRIAPEHYRAALERFRATGAPVPEGVTLLGRWHAPGSQSGFALCETDDPVGVARHIAEWGDVLAVEITPVIEDGEAAAALPEG